MMTALFTACFALLCKAQINGQCGRQDRIQCTDSVVHYSDQKQTGWCSWILVRSSVLSSENHAYVEMPE